MKKLLCLMLCIAMLAAPVCAADESTAVDRPTVSNRAAQTAEVNVDIEWDNLVFTYHAGSGRTWDAQSHSYQSADAGWTDETATITVTNHSDTGVLAGFSFAGNSGIRGTFSKSHLTLLAADDVAATQFGIDPDSDPITADGSLGQITVELQPMETATDAETLERVMTDWLDNGATELALVNSWAFRQCTGLESAQMPCVRTVGMRAFESCTKLTAIDLPCAETVGEYAFSTCTKLTAIRLPCAAEIGEYTFSTCTALPEITLPCLTSIPNGLFYDCRTLTSITFGSVITKVGSGWIEGISTGEVVLTLHPEQGNLGSKTTRFGEYGTFGGQTFREVRAAEAPQN